MTIIEGRVLAAKRKKERIKVKSIDDFIDALEKEGYKVEEVNEELIKRKISELLNLESSSIENIYKFLKEEKTIYRADNVEGFIDYIDKLTIFNDVYLDLCEKVSSIKTLIVERVEYERTFAKQEDVSDIIKDIEKITDSISRLMNEEDIHRINELESEIHEEYIYAKDIELLKKIVSSDAENFKEEYDLNKKVKTITIEIPQKISNELIKAKKGSVEYYEHLKNSIPRMERLINNIDKYIKYEDEERSVGRINQSEVLQDSINMAVAVFNNRKFKAISGSDEIEGFCKSPLFDEAVFISRKVNKLGQLGIGYDRVNDSEKKIFEAINKEIVDKTINNYGEIILYSKWEPCPSCYYVISQFMKQYPKIEVKVRYLKSYGE